MKTLLLLTFGSLPLLVLTAQGLFSAAPASSGPIPGVLGSADFDAGRVRLDVEAAAKEAADDAEFLNRLTAIELFHHGTIGGGSSGGNSAKLKRVRSSLIGVGKSFDVVAKYAAIYAVKLPERKELDGLNAYSQSISWNDVPGAVELKDVIDARITVLERLTTATDAFAKARHLFDSKRYDECVRELAGIEIESLPIESQSLAKSLRNRAVFLWHWRAPPNTNENAKLRRQHLQELIDGSPAPSEPDLADYLKKRQSEAASLYRQIQVDNIFENPPSRTRDLAEECCRILADDPDAKERLVAGMTRWIETKIADKPNLETSGFIKEAWHKKDGRYIRGVFDKVASADAEKAWYKFWASLTRYRDGKAYEETIYLSELRAEPVTPLDVRLAREFNERRHDLMQNIDSQRQWESFSSECKKWQAELEKYYALRQLDGGKLSFRSDVELTKDVVDAWLLMEKLLRR